MRALAALFTDACWILSGVGRGELTLGRDVEIRQTPQKGRGIFALRPLPAGTFVGRYTGLLYDQPTHTLLCGTGQATENYAVNLGIDWVLDAESLSSGFCHIINHSKRKQNCRGLFASVPEWVPNFAPLYPASAPLYSAPLYPYACFFELCSDVAEGAELCCDYGDPYWDDLVCASLHEALQKVLFETELVGLVCCGGERLGTEGLHFRGSRLSA